MWVPVGGAGVRCERCRSYYHRYLTIHGKYLCMLLWRMGVLQKPLLLWVSYQKYAMYLESNANLLINGYLLHTTDLMV